MIRNSQLLIFAIPLSFHTHRLTFAETTWAITLACGSCLIFKIGGGDFKLFSLLTITQGSLIMTQNYFMQLLIAIFISLSSTYIRNRNWSGSVPLAPSILAPFLLAYLDI